MDLHYENEELTYVGNALVEENCFRNMPIEQTRLPRFDEIVDELPAPIWDGHDRHLACYRKAWELAFGNLRAPKVGSGFVSPFIDTAFNGCIFMWDSSFMLMFGKYADRIFKFQQTLDNFYSHQHRDGFICREIDEETGGGRFSRMDPSSTGPNTMVWCEWEYYRNFGDKQRLEKVFPPLMAFHRWMKTNLTWPDGTYYSTGWGCGMDNLPRLQQGVHVSFQHGHMVWVDTCMQERMNCGILIDMCRELGREEFIPELEQERALLETVINQKLWDEESGFYYDLWRNGEHNKVLHIGAYWSLLAKCAPENRARRLIAHLDDEFCTDVMVPTLAKTHEAYKPYGGYWCGAVWAPTNYMLLKGLDAYGECDRAHAIGKNYLDAVVDVFSETDTLFENYSSCRKDGKAIKGDPAKADFVGWTGIAPIAVLFEYVFGIKPNAADNTITWHINLTERHGVERYPFGSDGELTLICEARDDADASPVITVKSNIPVTLNVVWGECECKQQMTYHIDKNKTETSK